MFFLSLGGAAGAVSRITGTLGKGLAALTMDEEYKRKRQQAINQRPATFQEGLARGGKGLVMVGTTWSLKSMNFLNKMRLAFSSGSVLTCKRSWGGD